MKGTHGEGSWLVNMSAVLCLHVLISWTLGWQQNCGCWNLANTQFPNKRLQVFSSFLGNMFLIKQRYCPKVVDIPFCFGHHDILEFINIEVALYPTSMVLSGFQALLGTAISPLDSYELGFFFEKLQAISCNTGAFYCMCTQTKTISLFTQPYSFSGDNI